MIAKILKLNVVIAIVLVIVSAIIYRSLKIPLSIALGSAIGGANFWVFSWIITGVLGDNPRKGRLAFLAILKFLGLIFVLWATLKWLPIEPIAFLVGLTGIVVSILCTTLILSSGSAKK